MKFLFWKKKKKRKDGKQLRNTTLFHCQPGFQSSNARQSFFFQSFSDQERTASQRHCAPDLFPESSTFSRDGPARDKTGSSCINTSESVDDQTAACSIAKEWWG